MSCRERNCSRLTAHGEIKYSFENSPCYFVKINLSRIRKSIIVPRDFLSLKLFQNNKQSGSGKFYLKNEFLVTPAGESICSPQITEPKRGKKREKEKQ